MFKGNDHPDIPVVPDTTITHLPDLVVQFGGEWFRSEMLVTWSADTLEWPGHWEETLLLSLTIFWHFEHHKLSAIWFHYIR